jgi:hypothetical protein
LEYIKRVENFEKEELDDALDFNFDLIVPVNQSSEKKHKIKKFSSIFMTLKNLHLTFSFTIRHLVYIKDNCFISHNSTRLFNI